MSAFGTGALAATGSTGNNTHAAVECGSSNAQIAAEFIVEAVGATPTVTWKVQGSHDGTNFYDWNYITDSSDTAATTALTSTAVGRKTIFLANPGARMYRFARLVTSANTNVTYSANLYSYSAQR